jgi:hypothetical protein
VAKVEAEPKLDNRNMIMVLAPDKRARQAAQSRATNQQRPDKSGAPATPEAAAEPAARDGAGEAAAPRIEGNGRAPAAGGSNGISEVAASAEEG